MHIIGYIPICKDDESLLPHFLESWRLHNPKIPVRLLVDTDNPVEETCGLETHDMVWDKEGHIAPFFAKSLLDAARKDGTEMVVKLDVACIHLTPLFGGVWNGQTITGYRRDDGEGFFGVCYTIPFLALEDITTHLLTEGTDAVEEDKGIYDAARQVNRAVMLHNYERNLCGIGERDFQNPDNEGFEDTCQVVYCGQCGNSKWGRKLTGLLMGRINAEARGEDVPVLEDITNYFERAFVVNLDYRPDRWEHFKYEAFKAGFYGFERFRAISGDLSKHPHWWRSGNGAWGCLMSHLRIVQDAQRDGLENYIVFEDDAILAPNFLEGLKNICATLDKRDDGWDMLYLGGQHLYRETSPPWHYDEGLVRCNNVNRTHCFALNKRFMTKFGQHIIHAPDYIKNKNAIHIDHQLGELHREYVTLAAQPWLVGQAESSSNITGQIAKENWWDDNGWGK